MKKIILSAAILIASFTSTFAQNIDEIIAKNTAVRGGAEKMLAIKTLRIENTMTTQFGDFENKIVLLVGKAMRSDTKIMENELVQAYDGTTAWAIMPTMMGGSGSAEALSPEMAKGIDSQKDPFPFLNYAEKGNKIELVGTEKVNGNDTHRLKITYKDGAISEFWLNATDGQMVKVAATQNGQTGEVFYSNFKEFNGVTFPMTMVTENPQAGKITIDTKNITINGIIDEEIFKLPKK